VTGESKSLLTFLPAPVAVGDPDGRAVYVNPAFAERFGLESRAIQGRSLAELFAGGAREAVLQATARVCRDAREVRFRLRENDRSYSVVAAPIVAEGTNVGLLFLFCDEPAGEKVLAFHREIQEPLADLAHSLDSLLEQTGGRRSQRFRAHVEMGLRAAERIRKWSDELAAASQERPAEGRARCFDPLELARGVGEDAAKAARFSGRAFELLLPVALPPVRGDGERLAVALSRFARERVEAAPEGAAFTLTAKVLDGSVLLAFTEMAPSDGASFALDDDTPPEALRAVVAPLAGSVSRVADPVAGISTTVCLPVAS
jgi:PAS domain S-box-containing protein